MKQIPTNLVKGQLYVDAARETILVPLNTEQFVAFHVSTINNLNVSRLEKRHRRGYEIHPANKSEFSIWEREQDWGDK